MTGAQLLGALALVFPYSAPLLRLDPIADIARASEVHDVPAAIVAAVCWQESRAGTDARAVSLCGTRIGHRYVDGALSADIAARSLARRHAECGTWARALVAYRWGVGCSAPDVSGYARRVLDVARRIDGRAR